jgi:predicted regulator of Ras-like GTPase activity (Roadblock/LC7/MglB family)
MITDRLISGTSQRLSGILTDLQGWPEVEKVVLCTTDGLTVTGQAMNMSHVSAVGGFMLSAANLSSNLLSQRNCQEITVEFTDDAFLVCRPFVAGNVQLILTVLFNQRLAYKRLLTRKVKEIQQTLL